MDQQVGLPRRATAARPGSMTRWPRAQRRTNRAGLLEPVSTHPAHQNRGLAPLVVGDALRVLREAGATVARAGTSGPACQAADTAVGFRPWQREITFRKRVRA